MAMAPDKIELNDLSAQKITKSVKNNNPSADANLDSTPSTGKKTKLSSDQQQIVMIQYCQILGTLDGIILEEKLKQGHVSYQEIYPVMQELITHFREMYPGVDINEEDAITLFHDGLSEDDGGRRRCVVS